MKTSNVLAKTKMNNKRNFNLFQNTNYFQNVSRKKKNEASFYASSGESLILGFWCVDSPLDCKC